MISTRLDADLLRIKPHMDRETSLGCAEAPAEPLAIRALSNVVNPCSRIGSSTDCDNNYRDGSHSGSTR
jgi:hypothetical protein